MSGTPSVILSPPFQDPPLQDNSDHSQAWAAHHQDVADRINGLPALLTTGVVDGSDASAGQIGEYLAASGGPVGIGSGVASNIATLALTAGDWDVSGQIGFTPAGTTHPLQIGASISLIPATLQLALTLISATFGTGQALSIGTAGNARINVAAATSVYLTAYTSFTTSTMQANGTITARRVR